MSDEHLRLSKLMAHRGLCSRREADELIAAGLVKVNGEIVSELGSKVLPDAKVEILPRAQKWLADQVTILINKPKGYVSAQPEDGYSAAVELVTAANLEEGSRKKFELNHLKGLAPAGRLDIDSQGLLVMTQNGVVAKTLIGDNSEVEKEYLVRVQGKLTKADLEYLQNGTMVLEGRKLRPCFVEWLNEDQLRFVLKEGMKRQIRKMCEHVGLTVTGLKRVRIGKVVLGNLPEGQWRYLGEDESFD